MKKILSLLFVTILFKLSFAQVSIMSAYVNQLNITPNSITQVNLMNRGQTAKVVLEAVLTNVDNEVLLSIKTFPFDLVSGNTIINPNNINISETRYGNGNQAKFLNNNKTLPSGKFNLCYRIISEQQESGDDYCEDIESNLLSFLYLTSPLDKETIETEYPLLTWAHSESFELLAQNESFRLVLTTIQTDQNAESALQANTPQFIKAQLQTHQVLYPVDATKLEAGKRYAWQVQKISNNTIIAKTEAWEFNLKKEIKHEDIKYAQLKTQKDLAHYAVINDRLYFTVNSMFANKKISFQLQNKEIVLPIFLVDSKEKQSVQSFFSIENTETKFYLDTKPLKLKSGLYTLIASNEKGEEAYINFIIE